MKRDLSKDATLTLPGITRPVGRPRTGKAKTAAERMRAYRERRDEQANEFPSRVTEIPDEWEMPQPPADYTADELERDNPFNQWMFDLDLVIAMPSRVTETVSLPSELPTLPSVPKGAPQMQIVVSAPRVFRPVMESAYLKYTDESGEQIPFAEFLGLVLAAGLDGF